MHVENPCRDGDVTAVVEDGAGLARDRHEELVVVGGNTDDSVGWFVKPTMLEVADPFSRFMTEELFAPVLTAYVYDDGSWTDTLDLVDRSSEYGLTGAVFAGDEDALAQADDVLRYAAGNFYVNDKPTGATVGQQPFGGARASGTNDKAGTVWNLIRFASPARSSATTSQTDARPSAACERADLAGSRCGRREARPPGRRPPPARRR